MCQQCQTKPVYEFTNKRKICKTCYIRWFEKKVLYTVRKFKMIKPGEKVTYKKTNDFRSVVLEHILNIIAENGRIKLSKSKNYDKLAIPTTIDSTAYEITKSIIKDSLNLERIKPINKKVINPLYLFLDKEVLLYAKLKKLKFSKPKEKKSKISRLVDNLEKKHPEIKRAIVNGLINLK